MNTHHRCEVCGRPATIHETILSHGVVTDRHVCYLHGDVMLLSPKAEHSHEEFQTIVEHYQRLSASERKQIALHYRLIQRIAS
jgi:hypothetical protein